MVVIGPFCVCTSSDFLKWLFYLSTADTEPLYYIKGLYEILLVRKHRSNKLPMLYVATNVNIKLKNKTTVSEKNI